MKKILGIILMILSGLIISCSNDDNKNDYANTVDADVTVKILEGETDLPIPMNGTVIEFTNLANGNISQSNTDSNGMAKANLRKGTYNITAKLTISKAVYNDLIDKNQSLNEKTTDETILFTASLTNHKIDKNATTEIYLKLNKYMSGGLVFKQIYYAGSSLDDGSAYRDQFVEIYNNSPETIFADGYGLALLHGTTNRQATGNDDPSYLPNRQYDWSKAEGNIGSGDKNKDYVYARKLFRIPGNGTQYPIEAGKSIIIASTAIDHTKNFVMKKPSEFVDPNKTVDLSKADFDVYVNDYLKNTYGLDITKAQYKHDLNTIGIAKLDVLRIQKSDLDMRFSTDDGVVLLKMAEGVTMESLPTIKAPKSNDNVLCVRIPNEYIVDGVQIRNAKDNRIAPRKLPESIDAGTTFVPGGTYSSQSLLRKTKHKLNDGRRVLQDSNNSTEDFIVINKPIVSKGEDSFTN